MGIDWHGLRFLSDMVSRDYPLGNICMFGRQDMYVGHAKARAMFRNAGLPFEMTEAEYRAGLPYSEHMLCALGAREVDSIDNSDFEGASIIADLNKPFPPELQERFDTCFDGGTIEHVFDIKLALQNQMSAVKKGGNLIIHTMANNWFGHGFYQLGADFFYRALCKENGYRIVRLAVHESYDYAPFFDMPDPDKIQSRIEYASGWQGTGIIVHAVRDEIVPLFANPPQQSDYAARWHASATGTHDVRVPDPAPVAHASSGLRGWLKGTFPGIAFAKHELFTRYPVLGRFMSARSARKYHRSRMIHAQKDRFVKRV